MKIYTAILMAFVLLLISCGVKKPPDIMPETIPGFSRLNPIEVSGEDQCARAYFYPTSDSKFYDTVFWVFIEIYDCQSEAEAKQYFSRDIGAEATEEMQVDGTTITLVNKGSFDFVLVKQGKLLIRIVGEEPLNTENIDRQLLRDSLKEAMLEAVRAVAQRL